MFFGELEADRYRVVFGGFAGGEGDVDAGDLFFYQEFALGCGEGELQVGGAEDLAYLAMPQPYRAANQRLVQIGEIFSVRGFDTAAMVEWTQSVWRPAAYSTTEVFMRARNK